MTVLKKYSALIVLVILVAACKKNNDVPVAPPNNDIIETILPFQKPYTIQINQYVNGYYEALPNHYQVTTKKYPVIFFIHGGGQVGDGDKDLPLVLNDGVAKEINNRKFPANFFVNGNNFSFIVLSPQFRAYPPDSMIKSFIDYALKHYRIDSSRIYLSGLSMGGVLTTEMGGLYPSLFAALVPIAGESFGDDRETNAANIAHANLPIWIFHNKEDPSISSTAATNFFQLVTKYNPPVAPKLTLFPVSGHDAWTEALDPKYKENNMNVYEWMLQYKK